jgi:hypothetical protein
MATKVKENEEVENEREGASDGPLLDLSDDAVKKMIKAAKKRGYVTMDELNSVLPSEEVTSEQIEDTMAMLSDMGINVIEDEDAEEAAQGGEEDSGDDDGDSEGGELAPSGGTALATAKKKEPTDRTDDPVRMYLREMGSVELLSREGEIAIAKRIEAGRETMIAGLCERVPRRRPHRSSSLRKRSRPTARRPRRRKRTASRVRPTTTTSPMSAARACRPRKRKRTTMSRTSRSPRWKRSCARRS